MPNSFVIDHAVNVLGKALNVAAKRHGLITSNVANLDTVGYRPKDLDFKAALADALNEGAPAVLDAPHPKHFPAASVGGADHRVVRVEELAGTVDIDKEMTRLAENNIQYRTSLEMLLRKMSMLRHTIQGG